MGERALLVWLLLASLLVLTGCGLLLPAPGFEIRGTVVNASAGEPVAGSRVSLHGMTTDFAATVSTDGRGRFALKVPPDRYEVSLKKPGFAGSRVIGLDVRTPTAVEIVQRKAVNPRWSTRPPKVELLGVKDGDRLEGKIPYRVKATGDNDIQYIYVALGKTPGSSFLTAPRQIFVETPSTGAQTLDPRLFGVRGHTTFEVVVYDVNGNRTHLIRSVVIIPPEGLVAPPRELKAVAVTLGKQLKFFGVEGAAAPAQANVYVELGWEPSSTPNLVGYRIYRSFDQESFEAIATVHPGQTEYKDASPKLAVGRRVYYRMTALRGGDESPSSNLTATRPLPTFDVRLTSPGDGATDVPTLPTFRWRPTHRVALYHIYGVVLYDELIGGVWVTPAPPNYLINRTAYRWNEDGQVTDTPLATLQPKRRYQWEVVYAVAVDSLEDPTAVSVAVNRFGLEHDQVPIDPIPVPATDSFGFTTGD